MMIVSWFLCHVPFPQATSQGPLEPDQVPRPVGRTAEGLYLQGCTAAVTLGHVPVSGGEAGIHI